MNANKKSHLAVIVALTLLVTLLCTGVAQAQERIREIQILGVQRIEPATVLTYLDVQAGDPMDQTTLNRALKSLFATGLFADVTLRQRGSTLEVNVVENPVISQIAFEGNDKLDDDQL
ncbi:MAG: POTRA domain-containing protein, partial [Pseudomonadota bacterium]|nr:POTRA domain-containing protein [Pseudomonadota bacterium]